MKSNIENKLNYLNVEENVEILIKKLKLNNKSFKKDDVKKVLLLWKIENFYIGDTCMKISLFLNAFHFFNNSTFHVNISNKDVFKKISHVIKNIPNCDDNFFSSNYDDINFLEYDLILLDKYSEYEIIQHLYENYYSKLLNESLKLNVYSVGNIGDIREKINNSFKVKLDEINITAEDNLREYEIVISDDENSWSKNWLNENGLKDDEKLIILLDTSSYKDKLLNTLVYFEFVEKLIVKEKVKILIFDENNIGKQSFYTQWFGAEKVKKIIFANNLNLRKAICLLGNVKVQMIIGPCTGLLHCASGIYRNYLNKGLLQKNELPLMITYVGMHEDEYNAWSWWTNSLVNCIVINKSESEQKVLKHLYECPKETKEFQKMCLTVPEITTEMLTEFINTHFKEKIVNIGNL
ncbi:MAG: hypothetical protein GQ564_02550 [Bacteroidales bacterium]|nr:hypothetical protein [Bacteroidales bacterium]